MRHVLAIDSGGSTLRAILFDAAGQIVHRESERTPPISEMDGALEHDPEVLWQALLSILGRVISKSNVPPRDIAAIGITNQRASFVLWDAATGKPLTRVIGWADVRAARTCDAMNKDPRWRRLRALAGMVSKITGNTMMAASSMLNFTTDHATVRLKWLLDGDPALRARCKAGEIRFGTMDTWFIHKLTGGKEHLTDCTNAGATGLYNPFELKWNKIFLDLFDIDASLLPEVRDTNGEFGMTDPALPGLGGVSIPIRAAVGDQMAALFGQRCFEPGSVKISQGSGAFVDMNVGPKPKLSRRGLLPLIAWRLDGKVTYMLEGYVATAGTLIDWLGQGIGLSDTPKMLDDLACQCDGDDTQGVVFVPTNAGIRYPYFNPDARGCIFGLSLSVHRCHVARAVLEGIACSVHDVIRGIEVDTKVPIREIKVDGGVSKSSPLLQSLADIANIAVHRAPEPDMTATGAAYLAGLGAGVWDGIDAIKAIKQDYVDFHPAMPEPARRARLERWDKAMKAVLSMY